MYNISLLQKPQCCYQLLNYFSRDIFCKALVSQLPELLVQISFFSIFQDREDAVLVVKVRMHLDYVGMLWKPILYFDLLSHLLVKVILVKYILVHNLQRYFLSREFLNCWEHFAKLSGPYSFNFSKVVKLVLCFWRDYNFIGYVD